MRRASCAIAALLVAACGGGGGETLDDAGGTCPLGGILACTCTDGNTGTQMCAEDGALGACVCPDSLCTSDVTCDDGVFCNGAERCNPSDVSADDEGCVPAGANPCLPGQTCMEQGSQCVTECEQALDADGDGHNAPECGGDDCDDSDATAFPSNIEICDASGHDEDCNPATLSGPVDGDRDGDGIIADICCNVQEDGSTLCGDDCDDLRSGVHPGASEACNGLDDDCSGTVDDGVQQTFYRDIDGDGFGRDTDTVTGCSAPSGYALAGGDCNDEDRSYNPAVAERCDLEDNNCDGQVDIATGLTCDCTNGTVVQCGTTDMGACQFGTQRCVDGAFAPCEDSILPVSESCNGVDDDCDGTVDNGVEQTFYRDRDGDGFGVIGDTTRACTLPGGYSATSGDCDDSRPNVHPAGTDICDGLNNDCDGATDEAPASAGCGVVPAATMGCIGGFCTIASCDPGFRNCNGDVADGCETDITTAANCGGCGVRCRLMCTNGSCDDAVEVHAGQFHTCALQESGAVACWGNNSQGELGRGFTSNPQALPGSVVGLTDAASLSSGRGHSCAIRSAGGIVCWGRNLQGQLGNDSLSNSSSPVDVLGISDATEVEASSEGEFTCAVHATGSLSCWGANNNGQLGDGTTTRRTQPVTVLRVSTVTQVALGLAHSCALLSDGTVACWGQNFFGQLGRTPDASNPADEPGPVPGLSGIVEISAGAFHTCARDNSDVYCWGSNRIGSTPVGQLGNGDDTLLDSQTPVLVSISAPRRITLGGSHSCARHVEFGVGRLSCWGWNGFGQIGDGTTANRFAPSPVSLSNLEWVSAGSRHTCAVDASEVFCWGANANAQLGDGTTSDRTTPTLVRAVPE